ncbi:MAG: A24 family peptidase [Neisseriaceae bacterium]
MEGYLGILVFFLLGSVIGSFLNVVVYRLPIMLEESWKREASLILKKKVASTSPALNLAHPASHCPNCQAPLRFYENIPLLSYIWQKAKCRHCQEKIEISYFLVESFMGLIFSILLYRLGLSYALLGGAILSACLIVIALIDLRTQIIPDLITVPLIWIGLLFNLKGVYGVSLESAVLGALVGYLALWVVYQMFRLLTGKEAMGYGDFKLFSALGAWLGVMNLPILLLSASVSGLALALLLRAKPGQPLPFGPAIVLAGLLIFIFSPELISILQL